jgi:hypothetical protein
MFVKYLDFFQQACGALWALCETTSRAPTYSQRVCSILSRNHHEMNHPDLSSSFDAHIFAQATEIEKNQLRPTTQAELENLTTTIQTKVAAIPNLFPTVAQHFLEPDAPESLKYVAVGSSNLKFAETVPLEYIPNFNSFLRFDIGSVLSQSEGPNCLGVSRLSHAIDLHHSQCLGCDHSRQHRRVGRSATAAHVLPRSGSDVLPCADLVVRRQFRQYSSCCGCWNI